MVSQMSSEMLALATTPNPSAWYFYPGAMAMGVVLALAVFGFVTATAGQRVQAAAEAFETARHAS